MKEKKYATEKEELEAIEKEFDEEMRELKEDTLHSAYERSPEEYNYLFDEFQKSEREARKEAGEETVDDMLDELEERRERLENPRTR